jgi:hypothetical protein
VNRYQIVYVVHRRLKVWGVGVCAEVYAGSGARASRRQAALQPCRRVLAAQAVPTGERETERQRDREAAVSSRPRDLGAKPLTHALQALHDAEHAIKLEPSWAKPRSRKALAHLHLHQYDEAIRAYKVCRPCMRDEEHAVSTP